MFRVLIGFTNKAGTETLSNATYEVELTSYSPCGAARRAFFVVASKHPTRDMDKLLVTRIEEVA